MAGRVILRGVAKIHRVGSVLLAATAVASAVLALVTIVARAALPYQLDYEEGNILNAAVRITHGLTPYPDPHAWPNVLNPYGPVMYYVVASLVKVFGVTFWPGRLVVIAAGMAVAVCIALLLKRESGSAVIGVGFGALFLCSSMVQFWWPLMRVDIVGLALSLAGMVVFRWNNPTVNDPTQAKGSLEWGTNRLSILLMAVLFVAAIFTKHTLVAAPAACAAWALVNRQKRTAVQLLAACAALGLGCLAVGEIATRGVLGFALLGMHPDPFRWSAYTDALRGIAEMYPLLAMLAVVLAIGDVREKKISLPLLYLLFAVATMLTIGKVGSNSNHMLEVIAALCLATGAGWSYLAQLRGVWVLVPVTIAGIMAFQLVDGSRELAFEPRNSACEQVIAIIRQQPGAEILSENTGAVVQAGKVPLISNTFVYTQLVKYGGWSDADLVKKLNAREVPMVVMDAARRQMWSRDMLQALRANYEPSEKCDCRYAGLMFLPKR
ncbi:MAG TPA: hypothetical protein VG897_14265 [Terriglobales bacterium]|nr:hypothetical protein [Terriglobales bacterium]